MPTPWPYPCCHWAVSPAGPMPTLTANFQRWEAVEDGVQGSPGASWTLLGCMQPRHCTCGPLSPQDRPAQSSLHAKCQSRACESSDCCLERCPDLGTTLGMSVARGVEGGLRGGGDSRDQPQERLGLQVSEGQRRFYIRAGGRSRASRGTTSLPLSLVPTLGTKVLWQTGADK